jgi:hypothetical protein
VLDANRDGDLDTQVTIGAGAVGLGSGRTFTVKTVAQSDKILANDACDTKGSTIYTCTGTGAGQGLSDALQANTLEVLASHTLALTYNAEFVSGFGSRTIQQLGCASSLTASLLVAPVSLSPSSSVTQVLAAANRLIANSAAGGSTSQTQVGPINSLLSCVNGATANAALALPVASAPAGGAGRLAPASTGIAPRMLHA